MLPRTIVVLYCILVYLLPAVCVAQESNNFFATGDYENPRTFYGGLEFGLNFSQVDGDTYAGYHKVGLNAGGVVYVRFSDHLGLSMELLYSRKGSRVSQYEEDANGVGYADDYDLKMNYAEVPVMLRYFAANRFHFGLGISYAQLINYSETAEANAPINLDPNLYPFHKQDIDWAADLNYMFYKGWFVNFRYSYSILSIRDAQNIPVGFGGGIANGQYHNYFALRLVYLVK